MSQPQEQMPAETATPDEVMAADQEAAMQRFETIAATAPQPEKPFSVQAIQTLIKQFNETIETLSGGELPDVTWEPAEKGPKWQQPLPKEIFVPLVALDDAVAMALGGPQPKYKIDPVSILQDAGLRKATAQLVLMQKDKKLIQAIQQPAPATEPEAVEGVDEEAELQENLA